MPDSIETPTPSGPLVGAVLERARQRQGLTSRLLDAMKPHTLHGGPALGSAQYLLARAREQGFEPKALWDQALAGLEALYPWALPVPFSYEQALQVPKEVQEALDSLHPSAGLTSEPPTPPSSAT